MLCLDAPLLRFWGMSKVRFSPSRFSFLSPFSDPTASVLIPLMGRKPTIRSDLWYPSVTQESRQTAGE